MKLIIITGLVSILVFKTIFALKNLYMSYDYLNNERKVELANRPKLNKILILIPVIREQNVIESTLAHFETINSEGLDVTVAIVGTAKELKEKLDLLKDTEHIFQRFMRASNQIDEQQCLLGMFSTETMTYIHQNKMALTYDEFHNLYEKQLLTSDTVTNWINEENKGDITYLYLEAPDLKGDRATQLNYALNKLSGVTSYDLVGVYDADSLPEKNTLKYVSTLMSHNNYDACQQPLHFLSAIKKFEDEKVSPLISASAIFQSTWSLTKELPNLINYEKVNPQKNIRCLYLNGHGEFFTFKLLNEIGGFPSDVITDGVQIGYRLSMSKKKIAPVPYFCDDDMPDNVKQIIVQHSRWYGGCMKIFDAFEWSSKRNDKPKLIHLLDGYHLQLAWAYSPLVVLLMFIGVLANPVFEVRLYLGCIFACAFFIYNYGLPYIALRKMHQFKGNVRLSTWLCLPVACLLKSIGPNIYFLNELKSKVIGKEIQFKKVER